jgi:hypothetical protein
VYGPVCCRIRPEFSVHIALELLARVLQDGRAASGSCRRAKGCASRPVRQPGRPRTTPTHTLPISVMANRVQAHPCLLIEEEVRETAPGERSNWLVSSHRHGRW